MFGKLSRVYLPNIFITLSRLLLLSYWFTFIIPVNFEKKNMRIFCHPMISPCKMFFLVLQCEQCHTSQRVFFLGGGGGGI